jgi:hypothetical protein
MPIKERLKRLCLIMVADTMADLAGIVDTVRSRSEGGAPTRGAAGPPRSHGRAGSARTRLDRDGRRGGPTTGRGADRRCADTSR